MGIYSVEFQRDVLSLMCSNVTFSVNYGVLLKPDYFDTSPMRTLFGIINSHVLTYEREIDIKDLQIKISDYVTGHGFTNDVYKALIDESRLIYNCKINSEPFVIDQVVKFVRQAELKNAILKSINILEKEGNYEEVLKLIDEAVSIGCGIDKGKTFDDLMKLPTLYRERYNPDKLVRTGFAKYDSAMMGGIASGELHLIQARPKCFTGDTKIRLANGTAICISEMEDLSVANIITFDYESGRIIPMEAIFGGKGVSYDMVEVTLDNDYKVKCTADHKWMLSNGSYKEAKDLTPKDNLMTITIYEERTLHATAVEKLEGEHTIYDIMVPDTNNFCIDTGYVKCAEHPDFVDSIGVMVHNSGKSTLGCNIGAHGLVQGRAIFHCTLELQDIDILKHYALRMSKMTHDEFLTCDMDVYLAKMERFWKYKPKLFVKFWPEKSANAMTIRSWISRMRAETGIGPELIILDYDDCLVPTSGATDDGYEDAGNIYSDLIGLSNYFKCLTGDTEVLTADGLRVKIDTYEAGQLVKLHSVRDNSIVHSDAFAIGEVERVNVIHTILFRDINGYNTEVKCTKDHMFFRTDMSRVQACELRSGDEVLSTSWYARDIHISKQTVTGTIITYTDEPIPVYCFNVPYYGNFVLSNGVVSSNCPMVTFAQPKRESWDKPDRGEYIVEQDLAHSAKKAHKAFSISSINFAANSDRGTLYMDMVRRGRSSVAIPIIRDFSRSTVEEL